MNWSRKYAGYSRSPSKDVRENPELGPRLEKIKKEDLATSAREFIDSLSDFFDKRGGLTENQLKSFEKIESRFSPQEKIKFKEWKKDYLKEYKQNTLIVAQYYVRTGYFTTLSNKIISDENYVPSKPEYNKMVNNKYAIKILEATLAVPKFSISDMVQLRATVGNTGHERHLRSLRSRIAFVLANDLPVINSTAGAKRYKILPMGESQPVNVDEKHLMKPNKRGKYS